MYSREAYDDDIHAHRMYEMYGKRVHNKARLLLFTSHCLEPLLPLVSAAHREAVEYMRKYARGGRTRTAAIYAAMKSTSILAWTMPDCEEQDRAAHAFSPKHIRWIATRGVLEAVVNILHAYPGTLTPDYIHTTMFLAAAAQCNAEYPKERTRMRSVVYAHQAAVFRDIFRNPGLPDDYGFDPAWSTPAVQSIAVACQQGAWDELPVLADALEDSGCTESAVLEHLRGPGPHVDGCWALEHALYPSTPVQRTKLAQMRVMQKARGV